jgi:hypothetical protein
MDFPPNSGLLLIGAVGVVGVLHTIVPDHWAPIALIARQRGWSKGETARAALLAGTGHVLSTLLIAAIVWLAGIAVATRFGHFVETTASIALIAFGGWVAISALREMRGGAHGHAHSHGGHGHSHDFSFLAGHDHANGGRHSHEPESRRIETGHHHGGHSHAFRTTFVEHGHVHHEHGRDDPRSDEDEANADPLYAPLRGDSAVLTRHVHRHRHGAGAAHTHWHDHDAATAHPISPETEAPPPLHAHKHRTNARPALLLILGSSPMVEGIPAFFAAGKYGVGLILAMSAVFAASTMATYVLLCVASTAGLQRISLGAFERYGEVLSGAFIALVGLAFWIWPVL